MLKRLLSLFVFGVAALSFGQNIVSNPSFEEVDEKGYPKGWWKPGPHWHGSEEAAYEGKRSLLFDSDNEKNATFMSHTVPVIPGKTYEFSAIYKVVVKPDAPKGHKGSMSICMEFMKDGKYYGGIYGCSSTSLNNEWTMVKGRGVVKSDISSATVALVQNPRNSTHIRLWVDCVDVHEVENEIFGCRPVTDCYRDEAASGIVNVLFGRAEGISPIPEQAFKESTLDLIDKDGKTAFKTTAATVLKDRVTYQFDAGKLPVGVYTMRCSVVNPKNGKTITAENRFTRLEKAPNHRVYVDKKRRLIVEGKPFFPLGMYHMKLTKENLAPYIDSAFNCLMPYQPPADKEMLDYLLENNLRIFYSAAHASPRTNDTKKIKVSHDAGYAKIDRMKYHPAIIGWYINDEISKIYLDNVIEYRRGCEEHDPDRPTWTVLCNTGEFLDFLPATDIHGSDPYPIGESKIRSAYTMAKRCSDATLGVKMVMQVPQAFCWSNYWHKYGRSQESIDACPMPTFEQMDAMAWMNIAGGANGLIFYSYFDQVRRDEEKPNLHRIPFEKAFGDTKKMAARVKEHEAVLLSDGDPEEFTVTSNPNDTVCFRAYGYNGETWLLAVNTTEEKDASFELNFKRPMTFNGTSLSNLDVNVSGTKVSATLKPIQSVFIRLK